MPVPPFILELRRHIGHAPLWLMGANALILRDGAQGCEVLLVRRADTGEWAPVSGIVDPGENPADTVVREAAEEAGVVVEVERLLWLDVQPPITYPNGDVCQYLDHGFRCLWVGGEARIADDESTAVAWFAVDDLPEPRQHRLERMLEIALADPRDVALTLAEPT